MTTQTEVEHAFGMFLDQIRGGTGVEKMFEQISVFAQIFDCDSIAYGARTHVQNVQGKSASMLPKISTYPEEWQEHCLQNGYDILDPSAKPGVLQWSPLTWDDAYKDPNTADRERRIFDEAKEFGLDTGVTIPLPWPWKISPTMSFVRTGTRGLSDFAITYLHAATLLFHIKVVECLDLSADVPRLTARQKECLSWVLKGKSSWDIGTILGITSNTVDFHIKGAMKRLGAVNRMVAAKKAEQLGLIEPHWLF
ncbi:LuxR family transcriptional regulator [Sinorhizobium meliloti]|uniref:autoinducer binding domain-containing protein n=1 Tax=Rhizobium meliloti TaxID=382 RepID=UPI000FD1E6B8|nr:autoinducer binding domain-containing protein [Sinorhizobium meliloti]MDX0840625.1 LuxR family transcriptional regulator [Sinorhizobium medicae]MDW9419201.1 LuxR family transcriptional regulator [Sinorhizobium meliloti]MDW9464475.1 LuxR family transcriptional regulator [Sinorhizobium meliloti]MDW9515697.1 LuxR family transcriptional regulator [Sinorhizobium meliloti]MDW9739248.1 LuxR family transcriptional regulator [Sinorhizobium meliloti]